VNLTTALISGLNKASPTDRFTQKQLWTTKGKDWPVVSRMNLGNNTCQ